VKDKTKPSPREKEVLDLLSRGQNNRQIAKALYIEECTVKEHVRKLRMKTGMRSRVSLAVWAMRNGFVGRAIEIDEDLEPTELW
jgi:DNA-binding NarL/FixJ family response regulator